MLIHLCELASAARFNRINLSLRPGHALEARGELGTVEEEAVASLDRPERRAGRAANSGGVAAGLVEGTVLLRLLTVRRKGLGERVGRRGWVGEGRVVDLCG
jgi:hypothetical protein